MVIRRDKEGGGLSFSFFFFPVCQCVDNIDALAPRFICFSTRSSKNIVLRSCVTLSIVVSYYSNAVHRFLCSKYILYNI